MGKGRIKQALELAGNNHRFQKIMVLLLALTWVSINFVLLGPTLIYMDPIFNCDQFGDARIQQQQACSRTDCHVVDTFTITSQLGLYCSLQWARDMIQSIFSFGSFAGLLVMNLISDTKGRKISTVISLFLSILGTYCIFLGGYFKVTPLLMISQFCGGFGAYAIVTLTYTLISDFCSDEFRSLAVILVNGAWGVSTMLLGVFYLLKLNWLDFALYLTLIPLITISIITSRFLKESPYILMNQNKKDQALKVLIQIAKINNRQENIEKIKSIFQEQHQREESKQASFKNVFKIMRQWRYFKPIILLTIVYGTGNLNFYGTSYAMDMQGLGFGYNSIIAGCVQTTSYVYLSYVANKIPRRKGIGFFYGLSALVGLFFFANFVTSNYIVGTIILGLSRSFTTIAYTLIACMQTQSFTVEIQSSAAGFIQAFSLIGALLAPLVVDFANNVSINPIAMISICIVNAVWPNIFMKETLVKKHKKGQKSLQDTQNPQILEDNQQKQSLLSQQNLEDPNQQAKPNNKHGPGSKSTLMTDGYSSDNQS